MASEQTVWQTIWPVVEGLIQATLAEDDPGVRRRLFPRAQAAALHDLFGYPVFDILLKTVLGRGRLGLTRAIATEKGRYVHLEYAWPEPDSNGRAYTAADVVAVKLQRYGGGWRVREINPAAVDLPLTEARAQAILLTSKAFSDRDATPAEPWILPVALFGGALQIPIRPTAMKDAVERLLLPGLQHRTFGVLSLVAGRRLWRDFKRAAGPGLDQPAAWAAAAEFVLSQQALRQPAQPTVASHYQITLADLLPRINQIKATLNIQGLDERYTSLRADRIVLQDSDSPED